MDASKILMLAAAGMFGLATAAYLVWVGFRWFWNHLWDWHENELTTKRGDLR